MNTNDILLTIDDIVDTLVGSFLVIIIISVLILSSILIINILVLFWYICKFLIALITIPFYKISKYVKNKENLLLREDEIKFKTKSLDFSNNFFGNDIIYTSANKCDKVNDNQSSTLSSQSNCANILPYEEITYITTTDLVVSKFLNKKNQVAVERNSVHFTLYTV